MVHIIKYFEYISLAHTQYYLQNIKNNNNYESKVLSNIDLSSIFPHIAIYPRSMIDFTLEDTTL